MYDIAINTVAFEFSCSTERVAKNLQQEITNYIIPAFNRIIDKVVSAEIMYIANLKISRIELDLGEMNIENFRKKDMMDKFESALTEQIKKIKNRQTDNFFLNQKDNYTSSLNLENEREILEALLLNGDVPWWMDKNSRINIDKLARRLLNSKPDLIINFIEKNAGNLQIWKRIAVHCKPSTKAMINRMFPDTINDYQVKNWFPDFVHFTPIDLFTDESIIRYNSYNKRKTISFSEAHKDRLLHRLLKAPGQGIADHIVLLNTFSQNQLAVIYSFFYDQNKKDNVLKERLITLLKKLTPLQTKYLLYVKTHYLSEIKKSFISKKNVSDHSILSFGPVSISNNSLSPATIKENISEIEKDHLSNNKLTAGDEIKSHPGFLVSDKLTEIIKNQSVANNIQPKKIILLKNVERPNETLDVDLRENVSDNKIYESQLDLKEKEMDKLALKNEKDPQIEINDSDKSIFNSPQKIQKLAKRLPEHTYNNNDDSSTTQNDESVSGRADETLNDLGRHFNKANIILKNKKDVQNIDSRLQFELEQQGLENTSAPSLTNNNNKPIEFTEIENEGKVESLSAEKFEISKKRQVIALMKSLKSNSTDLFEWLYQLPSKEVGTIYKIVSKHKSKILKNRKVIHNISRHPSFLSYNLLKVMMAFSIDKIRSQEQSIVLGNSIGPEAKGKIRKAKRLIEEVQLSGSLFFSVIENLSGKQAFIINDILVKRNYSTESERKVIVNFLSKLPEENITMLDFLTGLDKEELQQLIISDNKYISSLEIQKTKKYDKNVQRKVYIENGGLCLVSVYFKGLFNQLKYLEKGSFKNKYVAVRALYLIQYLVNGKQKREEYLLQFNKILCGFDMDEAIPADVRLTKKEMAEADALLEAIIDNWKALRNTTVQGFRESFLERKAILTESDGCFTLQVERKGYDLLLNSIPWSFNIIKFPWMKKMIKAEW